MGNIDDVNNNKKKVKQVKNGMLIIIIVAFIALIAIGITYYKTEENEKIINKASVNSLKIINNKFIEEGVIDFKYIDYRLNNGSNKDDYNNSIFKYLKYDSDYVIISTYSEYKEICEKIKNIPYIIEFFLNITEEFFDNNSLLIIDEYSINTTQYNTNITEIKNNNNAEITVKYLKRSGYNNIGKGSLAVIQLNSKIKKDTVVKKVFEDMKINPNEFSD